MEIPEQPAPPADPSEGWKDDPLAAGKVRYWDGAVWTERTGVATMTATLAAAGASLSPKTPEQRKAALAQRIQYFVNVQGGRVESQTDFQAVVVTGKKVNHVLHLILTLVTFGLWAIVWLGLAVFGGESRHMVSVDVYGQVLG